LGIDFVAGKKRVPNPAAGKIALRTFVCVDIVWVQIPSLRRGLGIANRAFYSETRIGCDPFLQRWRVVAQQRLPHNLDGRAALVHKIIMKFFQREARSFFFLEV
jgi:hypothetical protein